MPAGPLVQSAISPEGCTRKRSALCARSTKVPAILAALLVRFE